jgi:hypothetical protein
VLRTVTWARWPLISEMSELGPGIVGHTCNQSQLLKSQRQEDHEFEASLGKVSETLSQKQIKTKRVYSMVQAVECLP